MFKFHSFKSHLPKFNINHKISYPSKTTLYKQSPQKWLIKSIVIALATQQEMLWAGYTQEQIATMTQSDVDFFKKYALKPETKESLMQQGFSEDEIVAINERVLTLASLNEVDDGYGMRPMRPEELLQLVLKRIKSPSKNDNSSPNVTDSENTKISKKSTEEYSAMASNFLASNYTLAQQDKASHCLAKELTETSRKVCEKLGIKSLDNICVTDDPQSENEISEAQFKKVFKPVSSDEMKDNAAISEEHIKNGPSW